MRDRKNPDVPLVVSVDDEIGETMGKISACAIRAQRPTLRVFRDDLQGSLDF